MMPNNVTCGQLYDMLLKLGLHEIPHDGIGRVWYHAASGLLILLADRSASAHARRSDLASVRRHLVENRLIDESDYEHFLSNGELPRVPT